MVDRGVGCGEREGGERSKKGGQAGRRERGGRREKRETEAREWHPRQEAPPY